MPNHVVVVTHQELSEPDAQRVVSHAPAIVDRYTSPPYAPTMLVAVPSAIPSPPSLAE